jgi:hypothetical protein
LRLNRRQVLALTSLGAAAAGIGAAAVGLSWWNRTQSDGFQVIEESEAQFIRAFAGATWPSTRSIPHGGADLQLDHFFDESLLYLGSEPRNLIRLLIHALESSTLPSHLGFFSGLQLETRQEIVQGWMSHMLPEIRQAAQSLCILTGTGYSTHPDVSPFFEAMHGCVYGR